MERYNECLFTINNKGGKYFAGYKKTEICVNSPYEIRIEGINLYCGDNICSPVIGETVITCKRDCKEKRK